MKHINISINVTKLQKLLKPIAVLMTVLIVVCLLISLCSFYLQKGYKNRIYPNVYINDIAVGGLTRTQAESKLAKNPVEENIVITSEIGDFNIPLNNINFSYNYKGSINVAYETYRSGNWLENLIMPFLSYVHDSQSKLQITYDSDLLMEHISVISGQVSVEPVDYSVVIKNDELIIDPGKTGIKVDTNELVKEIEERLVNKDSLKIPIKTEVVGMVLSDNEVNLLKTRCSEFIGKSLEFVADKNEIIDDEQELFSLISPTDYNTKNINKLISSIEESVNRPPQNPIFEFTTDSSGKTGHVKEFIPSKQGMKVKTDELFSMITNALKNLENNDDTEITVNIPVETTAPEYSTEDVNDLGINELIGIGKSKFYHSIQSRIHNVQLASSHFNGVLVAPGEIFSFNNTLGDVSTYTGYQQAYIIQDGKTVLGDGGGVCQVSTTLFRAALDAGLPIVERRAHSYRVGYYEQESPVGIDATVFSPTTDFKFKNDTPGHLLIQTKFDATTYSLEFEIYGTSDGRVSTISKPIITNNTPPPEDLYVDDPTIPEGQVKQIDWKAWGAKVYFDYSVERGDETIYEKRFYSNYKPWQSIYLRGTAKI